MGNRVTLPAGTTLGKASDYGIDVNLGTRAAPNYQSIRRMSGYAPTFPASTADVASYDNQGDPDEDVDGRGFAASFTVQGNRSVSTGLYLPELEALIAASRAKGEAAVLDVRFYHKPAVGAPNPNDAGRADVTVEITRGNTGNTGIESFSVSITGKGGFEPITNPWTGWATNPAPKITSVTPPSRAAGQQVTITGSGFMGATDVKFGTTSASAYTVVNDSTIIAVVPAGTAGNVNVTVVTPAGTSPNAPYTRGA
ncbi:phage tail tube protein [Microbacterium thalli]|uniref:IPT/TIG domain-containing protein n=1 Tax=Microbacterium thalli TaxID=3027921 RepID=A0ABT5SKE6_9MICO|nr:IPT/TIG domain-containing protein [Microbacterium thalli]MDD7963308.1 IPT/TIG domain-containing protein [Microbacterium thalli]